MDSVPIHQTAQISQAVNDSWMEAGALHATGKKIGLHSVRRFGTETLRRARVPEDLTKLWLGHSKESVTDFYAGGLQNDLAWRQEWCERAGLGFSLNGLHGLQNAVPLDRAKAA